MKRKGIFKCLKAGVPPLNAMNPVMIQRLLNGEDLDGTGFYHQQVQEFQSHQLQPVSAEQSVLDIYKEHIPQIQERLLPELYALAETVTEIFAMVQKK